MTQETNAADSIADKMRALRLSADQDDKVDRHKAYGQLLETHFSELVTILQAHWMAKHWESLANLVEAGKVTVSFLECTTTIPASEHAAEVVHTGIEVGTVAEIVDELEANQAIAARAIHHH